MTAREGKKPACRRAADGKARERRETMGKTHALRLAALDLDGTLAPVGRGIAPQTVRMLRELEARGVRIALCSGKPVYYLCGLLRQVELRRPLLLGENGAVFQEGIDLPPE